MSIAEIKTVISQLPPPDLEDFAEWFEEFQADAWDRQIARDVQAGGLRQSFGAWMSKPSRASASLCKRARLKPPMKHFTTPDFWPRYNALPQEVPALADKNYELLKANPTHFSLRFKNIDGLWSVRVGSHYRALGKMRTDGLYWFRIGPHGDYDKFMP